MWVEAEIVIISQMLLAFCCVCQFSCYTSSLWKSNKTFNWHLFSSMNYPLQFLIRLESHSKILQTLKQERRVASVSRCHTKMLWRVCSFNSIIIDYQFMLSRIIYFLSTFIASPILYTTFILNPMKIYFNIISSANIFIHRCWSRKFSICFYINFDSPRTSNEFLTLTARREQNLLRSRGLLSWAWVVWIFYMRLKSHKMPIWVCVSSKARIVAMRNHKKAFWKR